MSFDSVGIGPKNFVVVSSASDPAVMAMACVTDRYAATMPAAEALFYSNVPFGPSTIQSVQNRVVIDGQAASVLAGLGIGFLGCAYLN